MQRRSVSFFTDRVQLDGDLYLADDLLPGEPCEIVRLDDVTRAYVADELVKAPGFGSRVTLESAEFLLRFRPERVVDRIAPRAPTSDPRQQQRAARAEEVTELYRRAGEPKRLVLLDGVGHTEWMCDEHPTFKEVIEILCAFSGPRQALSDSPSPQTRLGSVALQRRFGRRYPDDPTSTGEERAQ